MALFAVHYGYSYTSLADRDRFRAEHRAWLAELTAAGTVLSAGAYPDGSGALLIFRSTEEQALTELLAQDPFAREGLITEVRTHQWRPTFGAFVED